MTKPSRTAQKTLGLDLSFSRTKVPPWEQTGWNEYFWKQKAFG